MADIDNKLNNTTEQAIQLENELKNIEKELNIIPGSVIRSDGILSSAFDNINEQINKVKNSINNVNSSTSLDKIKNEIDVIRQSVNELTDESAKFAINGFDTSTSESIKSEINSVVRAFNGVDSQGNKIKDIIKEIDPELGKIIEKAIYTNDVLESLMGFVTKTGLKDSTAINDLAKGTNLGMMPSFESLDLLKEQIEEQRKYINETYPNGSNGLSSRVPRISDSEFFTPKSEIESYNEEIEKLSRLEKELSNQTRELENEQEKVNKQLATLGSKEALSQFKGYFDMYNVASTTMKQLSNFDGIRDLLSNPFYIRENSKEKISKDFRELLPKNEIKAPDTVLNELVKEEDAIKNINDKQNELIGSSKYLTSDIIARINSEESLNNLIDARNRFNREQLDIVSKIASIQGKEQEGRILDINKVMDANTYNEYIASVEKSIEDAKQLREQILITQNTLNNPNIGASTSGNILSGIDIEKFKEIQNIFNNGIKINASGEDISIINNLGKYIESIQKVASDFKIGLNPEVNARYDILSQLSNIENEGKIFNSSNVSQEYIDRARKILQITQELNKLNSNKNIITQNLNVKGVQDYEKLISELTFKLDVLNKKQEEVKQKMQLFGMNIPNTDNILTSNKFDYSLGITKKEIKTKTVKNSSGQYEVKEIEKYIQVYKQLIDNVENILKEFNRRASDEAKQSAKAESDAAKERTKAESDAAKATAEAQKQYEQNLNNLKNKVQEVTGYIKQAIANTIKIIREANSIVNRSLSLMIGIFEKLGSTVQRIISLFGNFGDRLKAHTKQGNILKGTYTELKSKIDLLVGAFNKLFNNQFINEGKKLLSSVQTLNMLIGTELTYRTMEWANNLEHAFGLSASSLIADLKEITAVLYGLGMSSKNVQIAATNLEAVAMSLSATTGYDFSTVINKIQSGMKGMTQSIDDLGLSVRESQMDAFLKKLKAQGGEYANIGTTFSQLTEQQRIYVRYAAIMDQFTSKSAYSAENYSKSLRTITGGLSVLNSQLRGLKSELGSLALQLFSKIVQPLIYIIYLVRKAVAWVAKLLNIDLSLNPLMNGGEENVVPIEDEAKALDDLSNAADKAKGSLDSLDHVSTLSSSSNKNKDNFDYSSLMDISGDYASLLEKLGKLQDDFIEECKRKFWAMINEIKDRFTKWVKDVTGRIVDWDKIKENFEKIKEDFKQTLENMKRIAKAAFNIIGGLLYSVFDDLDGTTLLAKFTTTIEKFTGLVATILEKIQPYIQNFYDKYLSKYVIKFGDWIEAKLDSINSKLDEWHKHWDSVGENDPAIITWFDELGRKVEKVIKFIKEIFIVFKALFGFKFSEKDTFDVTQMSDGMKSTLGIAHDLHYTFLDILDIITKTATKIFDFNGSGSLDLSDLEIALGKIKDKLDEIRQFIEDNKEPISNLLSETVITVSTLAAAKFDIIMQLIEMIVNNADTISSILRGLQDLIKWASENPKMAIGISIAGQTGFSVGKSLLTAYIWKKLLGLGAGGAAEMAAGAGGVTIGSKILAGIKGAILPWMSSGAIAEAGAAGAAGGTGAVGAGTVLATLGSTIGVAFGNGIGIATGIAGIREGFNDVIDGVNDTTYAIDNWIHRLRGENEELRFTSDNYKTFAYEVRRALTEVYGKEIDTSKAQRAFEIYAQDLQKTYNLTDEETESLVRNIERQYNRLSTSLDGALSTAKYSTDYSKNNIIRLADSFRTLDEKQTQTSDVSKKTSNSIQEDTKKSSDAIKTNVDSSVGSIEELNTAYNDSITDLKTYKSNTINEWNSISGLVTRKISTIKASISSLNNSNTALSASIATAGSGYAPRRIKAFATGGLPRSGSLFMANENGNTELVGNFGGYSGVANQNMIIEAMQNAMVQAIRQAGGFNNAGTTYYNYNIGNWLGDEAGIRKLAKQLNNANARSNSNIANTGFVMS